MGGILDLIALHNPTGFANANAQGAANVAATQAQTANTQAQLPAIQADVPLIQAQAQEAQTRNLLMQKQMNDQKIIQQAFQNLPTGTDLSTPEGMRSLQTSVIGNRAGGGIMASSYMGLMQGLMAYQKEAAGLTSDQLANSVKADAKAGDLIEAYAQNPDPDQYGNLLAQVQKVSPHLVGVLPPATDAPTDPNDPRLASALTAAGLHSRVLTDAKVQAEANESAAKKALIDAQIPGAAAESTIKNLQLKAMQNLTPQTVSDMVDAQFNALKGGSVDVQRELQNERGVAKAAATAAIPLGYQAVLGAIKDSADRIGRLNAGVAQAAATVPSRVSVLQGGADIQAQEKARTLYMDSLQTMNQSQSAAATLQKVLDLSNQGNKAAAGQLKVMLPELVNSVQGIKRLAATQANQDLGSWGDKLAAWAGEAAQGQPVPPDIKAQLPALIATLQSGSAHAHNLNVQGINATYGKQGAAFPTVPEAPVAPAAPQFKVGDSVMYQGKLHKITGFDARGRPLIQP